MNLQVIFFFYGLSFIVMGLVIALMPRQSDLLGIGKDFWPIGAFGFLHGLNEWIDLFILRGGPFNTEILKCAGAFLLPVSFVFLVISGVRILFSGSPRFKYVKHVWVFCMLSWVVACFFSRGFLIPGIVARYCIGLPGALLISAGLIRRLFSAGRPPLPRSVVVSTFTAAGAFFAYGIFSGLIVPKAGFVPASFANYQNFIVLTGMPVQFFRMSCAIILASSFFGMIGVYSFEGDKVKLRGGVKRKITLTMCVFSGAAIFLTVGTTFGWVHHLMIKNIQQHQLEVTRVLSYAVCQMLDEEIEQLSVHLSSPTWKNAVEEANKKYEAIASEALRDTMTEMDRKWGLASDDNPLVKEILDRPLSVRLRRLAENDAGVAEIFVTDRHGGIVATSLKTSDFYQADEEWWQKAYAGGLGDSYVGTVELDESSGVLSVPFSISVHDDRGQVIGVCKESMDTDFLFAGFKAYRMGKSGHAALVDGKGNILFHEGVKPLSGKLFGENEMKKILDGGAHTLRTMEIEGDHEKDVLNSFFPVRHPGLLRNGIVWYVVVSQDSEEVLSALTAMDLGVPVLALILFAVTIFLGRIIGGQFVKPIRELYVATEKIRMGSWDYEINVKTGDEIEELGDAFNLMTSRLKTLYGNLEDKVREKTRELSAKIDELEETKRAVLNVIDDLNIEKTKLEGSEKKLQGVATELKRSNLELEQFAYIASHDLQEPLRMVASYVQLLARRYRGKLDSDADEFIGYAAEGAVRMQNLINDLLDYSRVGTRGTPFVPTDCGMVLGWALDHLKVRIEECGAEITHDPLPELVADATQILQLFQNLLMNSIKFRKKEEPPRIHIAVKDCGFEWQFSFKDNGIGFDQQYAEKIFGIFQRLHGRDQYPGSGIGLAVCKKIVERHGGWIWAESAGGTGATFSFTIPKKGRSAS